MPCSFLFSLLLAALSLAGCGLDPEDPDVDRFGVSWSLVRDGAAVTCAEAGAARVLIRSERLGSDADCPVEPTAGACVLLDELPCEAAAGVTHALPPGELRVALEAVDAGGAVVGASGGEVGVLRGNGRIVPLGPFAIDVTAM